MRGLALKAWAAMMLLVASLMLGLGVYVTRTIQDFYLNQATSHLLNHGRFLAGVILSLNDRSLRAYLPLFSELSQAQVTVVNRLGQVVASSGMLAAMAASPSPGAGPMLERMGIQPGTYLDTGAVQKILHGKTEARVGFVPLLGRDIISVGLPLYRDGAVVGGILLYASAVAVNRELAPLWLILLTGFAVASLLAAVAAFFLSRRLSRPLAEMQKAALAMSEGNFDKRVPEDRPDELGSLGRSLNRLAGALDATIRELRQQRDRLREILGSLSEGVLTVDPVAGVVEANPRARELLGENLSPGFIPHPGIRGSPDSKTAEIEAGGRRLALLFTPLGDRGEEVVVIRDITDERRLEESRRAFLADIAHELRTPLSLVQGYTEALLDGVAGRERVEGYLTVILDETNRLRRLVDELLELSRLEGGALPSPREEIDLFTLTRDMVGHFGEAVLEKGLSLTTELPAADGTVLASRAAVERVVVNLLSNAVRYTPPGGRIMVRGSVGKGEIILVVENDGERIAESDLAQIFDRFYRIEKARTRDQGGIGLGLSIVRAAVKSMGGRVAAVSRPEGGLRFTVRLPNATVEEEKPSVPAG